MAGATTTPETGQRGPILLERVHVFQAGRWQGERYSVRDLEDMVRNFREHSAGDNALVEVPFVIGHEEKQTLTGVPAVGWVRSLWREGIDLYANVEQLFPDIARLIEAGAYTRVSPEIYPRDHPPEGVNARGCMLRRVAALGGQLPHIKQLARLPEPVRLAEPLVLRARPTRLHQQRRVWQTVPGTWACFFEVTTMAEDAVEQIATAAIKEKFPDLPDALIESFTPEQLKLLAEAMGGGDTADTDAAAGGTDIGAAGMVEWPAGMSREDVIAELVGMGEDQATLEAMSDDELLALYQQRKSQPADMSEPDPLEDDLEEDVAATTPTPAPPVRQPRKRTVTEQFSERRLKQLEARLVAAERRQWATDQLSQRRLKAAHGETVRKYCEVLRDENKVSAADVEFDLKTGKPVGPVAVALSLASPVRKFGEGDKSELDVLFESYRRKTPRRFGEQVPDPIQNGQFDALDKQVEDYVARRNRNRLPPGQHPGTNGTTYR